METIVIASFGVIFAVFISILVCLWYLNRKSDAILEKLIPALALGLIGSVFTLWFSLKEETRKLKFPVTYIINEITGETLEKYDNNYNQYYSNDQMSARRYLMCTPKKDWTKEQFHTPAPTGFDHLLLEALTILFTHHQRAAGNEFGGELRFSGGDPALKYFPGQGLTWENFLTHYKHTFTPGMNKIYSQLPDILGMKNMCLPKGTSMEINCEPSHIKFPSYRTIKLKNNFCEIDIEMKYRGGIRGLCEWKWILGYDDEKDQEFWTHSLDMYLSAKFNKIRSGHPDMPKYKDWAKAIFDKLQYSLDSKQQLDAAREKYLLYRDNINNKNSTN